MKQAMKLVNVKFEDGLGEKLEIIAKATEQTVTEVVRSAVVEKVEATMRDAQFLTKARERLDRQRELLG